MPTSTLIASSPTKEGLTEQINKYFYSTTYFISEDNKVHNSKGLFEAGSVEFKKGRYRFLITYSR